MTMHYRNSCTSGTQPENQTSGLAIIHCSEGGYKFLENGQAPAYKKLTKAGKDA